MRRTILLVFLFGLFLPLPVLAQEGTSASEDFQSVGGDDIASLKQIIEEQAAIIEDLSARLEALEERLASVQTKQEELKGVKPAPSWTENLKISGDYRFRFETIDEEGKKFRHRDRMRLRLALTGKVNDQVDAGIRLATGGFDPVSTNQTLTGGFSRKEFGLDLAYFDWHPSPTGSVRVIGGKMPNSFFIPGGSQLIWDSDLTPEGVVLKLTSAKGYTKPFLNLGYLWAEERSGAADSRIYSVQAGVSHKPKSGTQLTLGASLYNYENMKGFKTLVDSTKGFGNTTTADPDPAVKDVYYATDFNILEVFGEVRFTSGKTPLTFYGDYVKNSDAPANDNGYLYGFTIGKTAEPGTWSFNYEYRKLEKDAVVGAFSDSDFIGGGTDGKGHKFSFAYQLSKNTTFGLTYFANTKKLSAPVDYNRWQVDFAFKF